MKKMNNKGFAISTLLYGLSIMGVLIVIVLMSIMSTNRVNTAGFVRQIEEDLNRFSLTETTMIATNDTNGAQEYIVPYGQGGWYKIELWGAAGGSKDGNVHQGGKGAYTSGVIYLEDNTHLYIFLGTSGTKDAGGKNGGGAANATTAGGGGASDVRLESGDYDDSRSLNTRIMVAAGGGGATTSANGGKGGDLNGYTSSGGVGAAKQMQGNTAKTVGGGGGFRFGNASEGGSSYISGYSGVSSYSLNTATNVFTQEKGLISIKYSEPIYNDEGSVTGYEPKNYIFKNGMMMAGVNEGNGKVSIQKVSNVTDALPTKSDLANVKMIIDCVSSDAATWKELQAIDYNGNNVAKNATITTNVASSNPNNIKDGDLTTEGKINSPTSNNCLTVTLSANTNLAEVAVWHKVGDITNHSLRVCTTTAESSCKSLSEFSATESAKVKESSDGLHYSAYRNNTSVKPTDGNYLIVPVTNSSVVATTSDPNESESLVKFKGIDGSKYQKWSIQTLDATYSKILGNQNNFSLQYKDGTPDPGEFLIAPREYFGNDEEQWEIIPTKNGQYIIKSRVADDDGSRNSRLDIEGDFMKSTLGSGEATRFYLINVDY